MIDNLYITYEGLCNDNSWRHRACVIDLIDYIFVNYIIYTIHIHIYFTIYLLLMYLKYMNTYIIYI